MDISPGIAALIGSLGGIALGGGMSLFNLWLRLRTEERRHRREIVISAAIENWKHTAEISTSGSILPLSIYIIYMNQLCDLLADPSLSREQIKERFLDLSSTVDDLAAHVKTKRKP